MIKWFKNEIAGVLLLTLPFFTHAQVWPVEGSVLNYRLIGFSFPHAGKNASTIEIAKGACFSEDSFKTHIFKTITCHSGKEIAEVPDFGRDYTWRVIDRGPGGDKSLHHFKTGISQFADTAANRLRVLQAATRHKDAYIFLDGNRALYDMKGRPVWFLPAKEPFQNTSLEMRDLKMTPQGTITFLLLDKAYEINFDGDVLWTAPDNGAVSGENIEFYHHEFTRLSNGHYMILGNEQRWCKMPAQDDSTAFMVDTPNRSDNKVFYKKVPFGTVIEYDEHGKVVWSWKSSKYFAGKNLYNPDNRRGRGDISAHENSFFPDEKGGVIYVSFRNINTLLKVKYPEGQVLNAYGDITKGSSKEMGAGWFCGQHCCKKSAKGYLTLFNNNNCNQMSYAKLLMMQEPAGSGGALKKVWEYECPIEGIHSKTQGKYQFPVGGSFEELADGSMLVCMAGTYSKVFMITPDKKVLWSALPERMMTDPKQWDNAYSYRASIISGRQQLERLIWNSHALRHVP
jgi:hypothetical protein